MNLQTYEPKAMRTAKILDTVDMIAHGGMGCCTEAGELAATISQIVVGRVQRTDENIKEELGDAAWFGVYTVFAAGLDCAAIDSVLNGVKAAPGGSDADMMLAALRLCSAAEGVGTIAKAHRYYGKPLDSGKLAQALDQYFFRLVNLTEFFGLDFSQVLQGNVAKLAKRYPDKYTDQAAIDRADKAEPDFVASQNLEPSEAAQPKGTPWPFPSSANVGGE